MKASWISLWIAIVAAVAASAVGMAAQCVTGFGTIEKAPLQLEWPDAGETFSGTPEPGPHLIARFAFSRYPESSIDALPPLQSSSVPPTDQLRSTTIHTTAVYGSALATIALLIFLVRRDTRSIA